MLIVNIQKLSKILTFKQLVYNNTICLFSLDILKIKLKNRQNVYKFVLLKKSPIPKKKKKLEP